MPMGENLLISDGKRRPSSLMEIADNLSENVDAGVKSSPPKAPLPPSWESFSRHFDALKVTLMDILQVKKEGVTPISKKEVNIYEKKEVV
jgi:hypothetical protein